MVLHFYKCNKLNLLADRWKKNHLFVLFTKKVLIDLTGELNN